MEQTQLAISNTPGLDSLITLVASLQLRQTGIGRTSFVVTSKGAEVKTGFKVVSAQSLIISNNLDGTINPLFPAELQPRDRTRMSSKIQVSKIAGNLRPAQLSDSGLSSHGAPIVGPDNVVESGNGRSMGIMRAYEQGQAEAYRQYLIDHASDYGLKGEDIALMDMPVLVRERITDVDRAQFARDSNLSDLQEMAASEKAFVDAEMLNERLMALFLPSDEGNLLARTNDGFIRAFMREIGDTATAGLVTNDGRPTKQLLDRIQNAIFAKAYKDERLVKMIAEEPDPEMRNILTALNTAASDFAQMQMLSGDAHKSAVNGLVGGVEEVDGLDKQAIAALQEAINIVRQAKDNGQALEEVIAQQGLFEETSKEAEALALFIVSNNRSAKRIGAAFKKMAQKINAELTHQQQALGDMFGGGSLSLNDVLTAVSAEIEAEFGEGKRLNFAMFESAPGAEDGYITRMLNEATSVEALIRAVRMAGKIRNAWQSQETNIKDLSFLFRYDVPVEALRSWVSSNGYSAGVVRTMITSAEESVFYSKALREAVDNNAPAPSLADERNVHFKINSLMEAAERGEQEGQFFNILHNLAPLIPSEITWDEVKATCRSWLANYMNLPGTPYKKMSAYVDKRLPAAGSVPDIIGVLQGAIGAGKKALANIDDVMSDGKAMLEAAGLLSTDISVNELAEGYISALATLAELARKFDADDKLGLPDRVDFYVAEIKKVLDKPDKLEPYLKEVFRANTGFARDVKSLDFMAGREPDYDVAIYELEKLFSQPSAIPPMLVTQLHGKIKSAFDAVLQSSSITAEQAGAWSAALEMGDGIDEKAAALTADGRPGFNVTEVAAKAYKLTGGNLKTLNEISHEEGVRASASRGAKLIRMDGDTDHEFVLWHEIGHHIEFSSPHLLERAKSFLKSKAGDRLTYTNFGSRGKAEYKLNSSLSHYYMSKIYMDHKVSDSGKLLSKAPSLKLCKSTEVFSMALQCYADPDVAVKSFLNKDGLLEFFLGCLKEMHNAG
ncbi:hypothetical protein A3N68_12880 [Enterobacter asburiae]|nr:hypothetical protein [Enterobacter asburiae]KZR47710.1 hypothetical protein A3N68_12880 [Enterobacter asburiae]